MPPCWAALRCCRGCRSSLQWASAPVLASCAGPRWGPASQYDEMQWAGQASRWRRPDHVSFLKRICSIWLGCRPIGPSRLFDPVRASALRYVHWRYFGSAHSRADHTREEKAMSKEQQKFSVSYAKDGVYQNGLRDFLEYRDLGINDATHGQFRAHVVRVKRD